MPTLQQPYPATVVPPGLTAASVTDLVRSLPDGRGVVRVLGYYQLGSDVMVVYDVSDEHGIRRADIRVAFPRHHPLLAAGTGYSLGATDSSTCDDDASPDEK